MLLSVSVSWDVLEMKRDKAVAEAKAGNACVNTVRQCPVTETDMTSPSRLSAPDHVFQKFRTLNPYISILKRAYINP